MSELPDTDGLHLIWGADAIGEAINKTRRQTFYLLEEGMLPAKKIGRQWCISRSRLIELFAKTCAE